MDDPRDDLGRALDRALNGDNAAARDLVRALRPVIQARVTRVLLRYRGSARGRPVREQVDDLVQHVFVALFADGARELRAHDPALGLGLAGYVGLIAERDALSVLRSRRQSPFTEEPVDGEELAEEGVTAPTPERSAMDRDLLRRVVGQLREELSVKGAAIFEMLIVEERPVEQVCAAMQMTPDAVYAWRSRIAKRARAIARDLAPDSSARATVRREEAPRA